MQVSDYTYELPKELIAIKPPKQRGTTNLLVLDRKSGKMLDKKYVDLVDFLQPGDLLVLNDTKVIKARLITYRCSDRARRELVLLEKHSFDNDWYTHRVLYRGKIHIGDELMIGKHIIEVVSLEDGGVAVVRSDTDLQQLANDFGETPLPPYLHRKATNDDVARYQTVWAQTAGSVAAPTASLNMTNQLLKKIQQKGVNIARVTLHVGLGTFLPIRVDRLEDHKMHKEYFNVPENTIRDIQEAKKNNHRVFALGTTVTRTLEYNKEYILQQTPRELNGEADIFIYPGYNFKVVDCLITNYHAPQSTVLMMAAAFAGWDKLLPAYEHAINKKYNFLSYGDSMLII